VRLLAVIVTGCLSACADTEPRPRQIAGANPDRGLAVIEQTGCAACHQIPGVPWPNGSVGGSLAGVGARPLIAGRFANQPETLVRWIVDAPSLSPATAMPAMPLTQAQARDVAAYLYTLDDD
jgi:L-cysteine S-thiosulfotransferase